MNSKLSLKQVAEIMGVSIITARKFLKQGLKYTNISAGSVRQRPRIERKDLEEFIKKRQISI